LKNEVGVLETQQPPSFTHLFVYLRDVSERVSTHPLRLVFADATRVEIGESKWKFRLHRSDQNRSSLHGLSRLSDSLR
jgi:hypothetical protein